MFSPSPAKHHLKHRVVATQELLTDTMWSFLRTRAVLLIARRIIKHRRVVGGYVRQHEAGCEREETRREQAR